MAGMNDWVTSIPSMWNGRSPSCGNRHSDVYLNEFVLELFSCGPQIAEVIQKIRLIASRLLSVSTRK
jgi:hypothetical protein